MSNSLLAGNPLDDVQPDFEKTGKDQGSHTYLCGCA